MKFNNPSHRQEAGASQPMVSTSEPGVSDNEITFFMDWNGSSREFIMPRETLMHLAGNPTATVDLSSIFKEYHRQIIGVASRVLRAGAAGPSISLRPSQFR